MRLLGYGEDALTLWALKQHLDRIIAPGDSTSNVRDIFFRPSFGRRAAPQFGEFDAIVVSSQAVYLVEAKWTGSGELTDHEIVLRSEQTRRHRVFREYLRAWRRCSAADWKSFVQAAPQLAWQTDDGVEHTFAIAPDGSRLGENLAFVLASCARGGDRVDDVLVVVHPVGEARALTPPEGFRYVGITAPPMDGNFVLL